MPRVQVWLHRMNLVVGSTLALSMSSAWADSPIEQVEGHLAAGEFGLAAEAAGEVADLDLQAQLLKQVAAAQPVGATRTLGRIADEQARLEAQGNAAQQAALNGGASFADFQSLIQIIQENTSGMWEAIDGSGGTATPFQTGVRVAPARMLSRVTTTDQTGRLKAIGQDARQAALNDDMAQTSKLRLVSLSRLERQVAQRLEQGLPVPESMARLAGLTKVEYVFVDQVHKDIILGGPAEAWEINGRGEPMGVDSRRPTLQLDDLVVVLRAFSTGARDFGCSINTRDAGVKALQEYAAKSQARGPLNANAVRPWVKQLGNKLGKQDIVVWGVPHDSRVARVIVEADYRMKLIGIEKLEGGPGVPSYFELLPKAAQQNPPAMEALRWWLSMKYDAVAHSPDKSVFELQGSAVLCQSENQMLTAEGKHLPTGQSEPTNREFAERFTQNYADLAARDQVFADMQNIFDLALVAALVRQERLPSKLGWSLGSFAADGAYRPGKHAVPREIDSVVNHKVYNGRDVVVQVAGGVRADLTAVAEDTALARESAELAGVAQDAAQPELAAGRWWWDAK